jgi:hypothetical protein
LTELKFYIILTIKKENLNKFIRSNKMKTKHTPGPWRYDDMPLPSRGFVRIGSDICHIPKKGKGKYYGIKQLDEETQANIHLIASAPDMAAEIERLKAEKAELLEIAALALNWWHGDDANFDNEEPDFIKLAHKCEIARDCAVDKDQAANANAEKGA